MGGWPVWGPYCFVSAFLITRLLIIEYSCRDGMTILSRLGGGIPLRCMAWSLLVYVGCGLPEICAGRSPQKVMLHWIYARKSPGLTLHAPNWYQWIYEASPDTFHLPGLLLTITVSLLIVVY